MGSNPAGTGWESNSLPVMKDVTTLRENCEDIAAAAADINEERQRQYDAQMIEDAKAILAQAQESGAEANA